jgi:hypothetical protein
MTNTERPIAPEIYFFILYTSNISGIQWNQLNPSQTTRQSLQECARVS